MTGQEKHRNPFPSGGRESPCQKPVARRALLGATGGLLLAGTVARPSLAQQRLTDIVVTDWGGASTVAFRDAWADLLRSRYGFKLELESSGAAPGRIRAMVESRKVIWDVCDTSSGGTVQLGEAGLLEEIDYNIVDRSKVRPQFALKYGVCNYLFSYVMAVNSTKFGDNQPRSWADFYDLRKFPGRRTMRALVEGQLEGALLADGVAPADLYPLDMDRALAKISTIKDQTIFWRSGAESESLFRSGEVVMGSLWSGRANVLRRETNGRTSWRWDGAILAPSVWAVPKGNPAGKEAAMRCIAALQDADGQAAWFRAYGNFPANPAAAALTPEDLKPYDGNQPENAAVQIPFNVEWYARYTAEAQAKYLRMISS